MFSPAGMKQKDISHLLTVTAIPNSNYADWSTGPDAEPSLLRDTVLEPNPTAWRATLSPALDFDLIVPLSFSFVISGMNASLSFNDPDDQFTAVSHIYAIWSNAGNVSYPGYNRSADAEPWDFRAVEFLFHLCVNTYSVSYQNSKTTTEILSSSNIPLRTSSSAAIPDAKCGTRYDNSFFRDCNWIPTRDTINGTVWLQDPQAPASTRDTDLVYGLDHQLAIYIEENIMGAFEQFYMWDGIMNHKSITTSSTTYLRFFQILISEDILETPEYPKDFDKQFRELGEHMNGMAISVSNM
jgi:hypothetical protein